MPKDELITKHSISIDFMLRKYRKFTNEEKEDMKQELLTFLCGELLDKLNILNGEIENIDGYIYKSLWKKLQGIIKHEYKKNTISLNNKCRDGTTEEIDLLENRYVVDYEDFLSDSIEFLKQRIDTIDMSIFIDIFIHEKSYEKIAEEHNVSHFTIRRKEKALLGLLRKWRFDDE